MKNILLILVVLLAGCGEHKKIQKEFRVSSRQVFTPSLSWSIACHQTPDKDNQPVPKPPQPGVCTNCDGKGYMPGDGVVRPICPVCKGSGKIDPPSKSILRSSYFIVVDGDKYRWDGTSFVSGTGKVISFTEPFDIERTEYVKICRNNTCQYLKVQRE